MQFPSRHPHDTFSPSSPTLSQSLSFVATTSTRIKQISWNQPKNPVPLHQVFESYVSFSIFVLGYWLFGLKKKKARSGGPYFVTQY